MMLSKKQLGEWGELKAVSFLEAEGYDIIKRNYRNALGEIDIIAKEGDVLCFVEVRTRTSDWQGHPFESITKSKKNKLSKTALSYLKAEGKVSENARFDVIAAHPKDHGQFEFELLKDAFDCTIKY